MKKPLKAEIVNDVYYLSGTLINFNEIDVSGRFITMEEFLPHLEKLQNSIDKDLLIGEFNNGDYTPTEVSSMNYSHLIEKIEVISEDCIDSLIGKFRVFDTTEMGKILKVAIDSKTDIYSAYRMLGSVNDDHSLKIYKILAFDVNFTKF